MIKNRRNYYRILKVQSDAPVEIIRSSYRTMMRELSSHPDLGGSTYQAAVLNEAYETLSNPARRAEYDKKIQANRFRRGEDTKEPNTAASKPKPEAPESADCAFCRSPLTSEAKRETRCPTCDVPLPSHLQQNWEQESRRTIARMKKNEPMVYSREWPENPKEGTMIDLSPRGMRFRCSEKIEPGTVLKISTSLLKACGKVTNQRQEPAGNTRSFTVGVSFIAVTFEETRGAFFSVSG
jgi:hypothetical protein